ncbi:hypothetical protein KIPB_001748, partial [Kipferlia bialata]|eukprot:g1748.t1
MFCSEMIPTTELVAHTRECRKHHIRVTNSVAREHLARYEAEVKRARALKSPFNFRHCEEGLNEEALKEELDALFHDDVTRRLAEGQETDTLAASVSISVECSDPKGEGASEAEDQSLKSRPRPISPFNFRECEEGIKEEALKEELDALFHDDVTRRLAEGQETETVGEFAAIIADVPKRQRASEGEEQTLMQHFEGFNPEMSERLKALTERVKAMDVEALYSALDSLETSSHTALQEKLAAVQAFMSEHTLEKVVSEDCGALVDSLYGLCTKFHASLQTFSSQRDHSVALSSVVEAQELVSSFESIGLIPLPRDTMSLSLPDKVKYVVVEDYNNDVRGVLRLIGPLIACSHRIQHCIGVRGGVSGVDMAECERVQRQSDTLLKALAKLAPLQKEALQWLEEYKATPPVSDSDIEGAEYDVLVAEVAAKNPRLSEDLKTDAVTQVQRYQKKVLELKHSQATRQRLENEMRGFLVQWDRAIPLYTPGEPLQATVSYTPSKDITVTGVSLSLFGEEHVFVQGERGVTVNRRSLVNQELLSVQDVTAVSAGQALTFPIQTTVPPNLPWSVYSGNDAMTVPGRKVEDHEPADNVRYFVKMVVRIKGGMDDKLGASVYVLPPPGGRYLPLPMDPARPGEPVPMSAQAMAVSCCTKKDLVNVIVSVPSLVASVGEGTHLHVHIDNLSTVPVTKVKWALKYGVVKRFNTWARAYPTKSLQGIEGTFVLPTPVPGGTKTQTPILILIRPN